MTTITGNGTMTSTAFHEIDYCAEDTLIHLSSAFSSAAATWQVTFYDKMQSVPTGDNSSETTTWANQASLTYESDISTSQRAVSMTVNSSLEIGSGSTGSLVSMHTADVFAQENSTSGLWSRRFLSTNMLDLLVDDKLVSVSSFTQVLLRALCVLQWYSIFLW
mgnify:FL=1